MSNYLFASKAAKKNFDYFTNEIREGDLFDIQTQSYFLRICALVIHAPSNDLSRRIILCYILNNCQYCVFANKSEYGLYTGPKEYPFDITKAMIAISEDHIMQLDYRYVSESLSIVSSPRGR